MYGQLGHGSTDKQSSPKVVEALSDKTVYLLACGNFHTVSLTLGMSYLEGRGSQTQLRSVI